MAVVKRLALVVVVVALSGCGGSALPSCFYTSLSVSPQNATADHLVSPPGNQVSFAAFGVAPSGCAVPQSNLTTVVWSVSDTADVSISDQHDPTYGVATCRNATSTPAIITATLTETNQTATGSTTLTCR